MGKLPLSVTVSAAVHVVLVAFAGTQDMEIDHEVPPPPSLTTIELVDTSSTPAIELTTAAPAPAATLPSTPAAEPSRGVAISTSRPSGTSGVEPGRPASVPDKPTGERSRYFDMRRGERADLTLPGTRDDLDNVPAGTTPEKPPSSGKLAPNGGEHKTDEGTYVAKVDKDGRVTMKDRPDFSIGWAVPTPKLIGRGIAEWYESDKGEDGKRGKRTLENEVSGTIDKPTMGCEGVRDPACSPERAVTVVIPVFRGGFNPTDWLMRRTVGDPYASKKREYLDATREERAQIRANHRSEQLEQTVMIIRKNLDRAWASTTDMAARKKLLFELWDEIVERPTDEESALAEASKTARAQVIAFIRARLPQRGQDAYREDELLALNSVRQSKQRFSPYD
ncbi:MAG: hypothetical protein M4D80_37730 [Myxococcota bacterium]|nr:hypothetical protein [Myxococcota bacterium]